MKKIFVLALVASLFTSLVNPSAMAASNTSKVKNFTALERLSGDANLNLSIATRDIELDLLKRRKAIFKLNDVRTLFVTNDNTGVITLNIYNTLADGSRAELLTSQSIVAGSNRRAKNMFFSQGFGDFDAANPTKNIELEVLASNRSVAATFKTTVTAINLSAQTASVSTSDFTCDGLNTEECFRGLLLNKVKILPRATRNRATNVVNNTTTNDIEFLVPVLRK